MDGNRFLPLLGLPHTDPDVGATLRALQIMRDPQVAYKDEEDETTLQTQDFVGNLHLGFGAALGAGRAPHLASARGAIANSRLHELPDGRFSCEMKRTLPGGKTHLTMTGPELLKKLIGVHPTRPIRKFASGKLDTTKSFVWSDAGITTDLLRRVHEHNAKARGARYTKTRRPVVLKSSWTCASRSEALRWEHAFKGLNRSQKLEWVKRLAEDAT